MPPQETNSMWFTGSINGLRDFVFPSQLWKKKKVYNKAWICDPWFVIVHDARIKPHTHSSGEILSCKWKRLCLAMLLLEKKKRKGFFSLVDEHAPNFYGEWFWCDPALATAVVNILLETLLFCWLAEIFDISFLSKSYKRIFNY